MTIPAMLISLMTTVSALPYTLFTWGPTIIGTKTYAKVRLPKRVLLGRRDREEAGGRPSGSNRSP